MADDVRVLSAEEQAELAVRHVSHSQYQGKCEHCWKSWPHCPDCGRTWPCLDARWEATCAALEARLVAALVALTPLAALTFYKASAWNSPSDPAEWNTDWRGGIEFADVERARAVLSDPTNARLVVREKAREHLLGALNALADLVMARPMVELDNDLHRQVEAVRLARRDLEKLKVRSRAEEGG